MAKVEILFLGDSRSARKAMRELGVDSKSLESQMIRTGRTVEQVGDRMMRTSVAVGTGLGASVFEFGSFDAAMQQSISIMGDVDEAMRSRMIDTARQVARDLNISATQAAESYFFLASAGLDAEQSIAALPAVARFAKAGMFDMALATDLATDAQSALGLTVDDSAANLQNMTRVTDVLVRANILANASVEQFSTALTNKAGAALRTVNKDVEEGVAVLAAFADQGVKGEDAGEKLSIVLRDVTRAAGKNREEFERLGIEVFDQNGNLRNLADVVGEFETVLGGMSDAEKAATFDTLGLTRGVGDALRQLLGTSDAIRTYEADLRSAGGAAQDVADKQLAAFNEQVGKDIVVVREAGAELGENLAPAVLTVTGLVADMADGFTRLPEPLQTTIGGVGALVAAAGPALVVGGKMVQTYGRLGIVLQGTRFGPLVGGAGAATSALLPAAAAAGAAVVAINLLDEALDFDADIPGLVEDLESLGKAGEDLSTLDEQLGDLPQVIGDIRASGDALPATFVGLADGVAGLTFGLVDLDTTVEQSAQRLEAVGDALGQMVQSGNIDGAARGLLEVARRAEEADIPIGELLTAMPGLSAELAAAGVSAEQFYVAVAAGQDPTEVLAAAADRAADAGTELGTTLYATSAATADAVGATEDFVGVLEAEEGAAAESQSAIERLNDALRASADPLFAAINAEQGYEDALARRAEVAGDAEASADDLREADLSVADAALGLKSAQAELDQGLADGSVSVDGLRDALAGLEDDAPATLRAVLDAASIAASESTGATDEIGRQLGLGLVDGIEWSTSRVAQSLVNVVLNAEDAAKLAARIRSPSARFAEEIGRPLTEGVAQGILDEADAPASAIQQVLEQVKQEAQDGVNNVLSGARATLGLQGAKDRLAGEESELAELRAPVEGETRGEAKERRQAIADQLQRVQEAQLALVQAQLRQIEVGKALAEQGGAGGRDFVRAAVASGLDEATANRLLRSLAGDAYLAGKSSTLGIFHEGGVIGPDGRRRPPGPGEVDIRALAGEEVLTESDPRHRRNIGQPDGTVGLTDSPSDGVDKLVSSIRDMHRDMRVSLSELIAEQRHAHARRVPVAAGRDLGWELAP